MGRQSALWKYFDYVDERFATCKACDAALSHSSSSTNLRKHLARKHPEIRISPTRKYKKPKREITSDDDDDGDNDDDSYGDDPDDVKTLLELSGAQVNKTVEIIEEVNNGNHIMYHDDNDDLVIKRTAKPALKRCLESIESKIKREPSPSDDLPLKRPEDPVDVLTKNIGNKLRKMCEKQQIIAEYRIHEILFLGLSNQLKCPIEDSNHHLSYSMQGMNQDHSMQDGV